MKGQLRRFVSGVALGTALATTVAAGDVAAQTIPPANDEHGTVPTSPTAPGTAVAQVKPDPEAQAGTAIDTPPTSNDPGADIVVTGVLRDTVASKAPISLTTVGSDKIRNTVAISAADLLTEVPGVVVNSNAGEARNIVSARGLGAGTTASTFGYYWTTLLEDGLPIVPDPYSNYQPDFFLRADATIRSVQAVRGGSAAVTGPNAPGGLFNYLSRNGMTDPGGIATARFGIEGGKNLYQKYDIYYGWHNSAKDLAFSIGGNYRRSYGYRDIDYPLNNGGQLKANLNYTYSGRHGSGGLLVSFKYLNDSTGFLDNYKPLTSGFASPQFLSQFGGTVNFLPVGDLAHTVPYGANDSRAWDPSDFSQERQYAFGVKWDHDFGQGWKLSNNGRVQRNAVNHTYATDIAYQSLLNAQTFTLMGTQAAGLANTPGYFTISDRASGQVLARVDRITAAAQSGSCVVAVTNGYCIDKAVPNLLPNQTIVNQAPIDSSNLILTVGSSNSSGRIVSRDVTDLFTLTKSTSTLTITAGVYFNQSHFTRNFAYAGRGLMPLQNNPTPRRHLHHQFVDRGRRGGRHGVPDHRSDRVRRGRQLGRPHARRRRPHPGNLAAVRHHVGTHCQAAARLRRALHHVSRLGPEQSLRDQRQCGFADLRRGRRQSTHDLRQCLCRRHAGRAFLLRQERPLLPVQRRGELRIQPPSGDVPPLYGCAQEQRRLLGRLQRQPGAGRPILAIAAAVVEAGGVRGQIFVTLASAQSDDLFRRSEQRAEPGQHRPVGGWRHAVHHTAVLQPLPVLWVGDRQHHPASRMAERAERRDIRPFAVAVGRADQPGTCNGVPTAATCPNGIQPQDDDTATYLSGPEENEAKFIYNGTVNLAFGKLSGYYRFRHISSRPLTVSNTFRLPPQNLSDMGLRYDVTDRLSASFNINNLFDTRTITSIGAVGTIPSNLTQAQFVTQYPNALSQVITSAPRSYFLTLGYTF